jgi:hypothetical protein
MMSTDLPNPTRRRLRLLVTLCAGLLIAISGVLAVGYIGEWFEDFTYHR